ncbi:hypothetical protein C7M84_023970 [Penaeus vannamei]|nr:hypothetical protein C7M84_023970 [Penaeus vannamei]
MASDRSVVMRSQRCNFELEKRRPVQFSAFFGISSLSTAIFGIVFGVLFYVMASISFTRSLLLKYPEFFTFGLFSRKGPKREDLVNMKFCVTLTGKGWEKKIEDPEQQHTDPPTVSKTVTVVGPDPGYFGTATIVSQCALTVLQEKDKLPKSGGVFPPGAAFVKTTLRSRLEDNGISFKVKE